MIQMIEMEYKRERLNPPIQLASGVYQGYNYYVLSHGTHPCGYVEIPKGSKYYNTDYMNIPIECHGGLTYSSNYLITVTDEDSDRFFIGWDYAHFMDYVGYFDNKDLSFLKSTSLIKWTTMDIIYECMNVIEQINKLEADN